MTARKCLCRDQSGAAVIEMAIVLPVLILFIWGIFQVGVLFQANSGMQHALGEGARFATIWPTPTDAQIKTRITDKVFGTNNGTYTVANPVSATGNKTLTVTYSMPMNFLLFDGPTVTLTRTKVVYVTA